MMLGVALVGFDGPSSSRVAKLLGSLSFGDVSWRPTSMAQSDAWCVNARRLISFDAKQLWLQGSEAGGEIQVLPSRGPSFPIALGSLEASSATYCALPAIDLSSAQTAFAAFCQFGAQLMPRRCEYALGAVLAERLGDLVAGGVYHLLKDGRLVALVDLGEGVVGCRPGAGPAEIRLAKWHKRPQSAGQMPEPFLVMPIDQLLKMYASRAVTVVLPEAYSTQAIHWRGHAKYASSALDSTLSAVVERLQARPMTMAELTTHLGWPGDDVARAIRGLDLLGVVSTRSPRPVSTIPKAPAKERGFDDGAGGLAHRMNYAGA